MSVCCRISRPGLKRRLRYSMAILGFSWDLHAERAIDRVWHYSGVDEGVLTFMLECRGRYCPQWPYFGILLGLQPERAIDRVWHYSGVDEGVLTYMLLSVEVNIAPEWPYFGILLGLAARKSHRKSVAYKLNCPSSKGNHAPRPKF